MAQTNLEFSSIDLYDAWKYREAVVSQVNIIELMLEYKIRLEPKGSGQFTHRTRCPFHSGKNGKMERTPSLYVSEETNSFYCFGPCDAQGTVIDFVSLMDGTPPVIALVKLAKKIGIIDKDGKWDELRLDSYGAANSFFEPKKTIDSFLFDISFIIRDAIFSGMSLVEIENITKKIDKAIDKLEYDDWEKAEKIYLKVKKIFKEIE
jgi:hypothetical protein